MPRNRLFCRGLLALGLLGLLAATAPAADKPKADPPGTSAILGQLRTWFKSTDLNSDDSLDKEELAKAFRGPDAKPYDYKASKSDSADKDKDSSKGTKSTTKKPDYSKYPDYLFLTQLDKDGDEQISRDEFESWARDYAVQLKQALDTQNRIALAEAKLARGLSAKETRQVQSELRKQQAAMKKMDGQMKSFDKHIMEQVKKNR